MYGENLRLVPVVANDFETEKAVLQHLAIPDIVYDQMPLAIGSALLGNNPDMGDSAPQVPANDVAGPIIGGLVGKGQCGAFPSEKGHQIGYPAMVDVRIRALQSPFLRIEAEICFHIKMHLFLQVDAEFPVGANDHVRAHAFVGRHVAIGIAYLKIGGIVLHLLMRQRQGGVGQTAVEILLRQSHNRDTKAQQEQKQCFLHCISHNRIIAKKLVLLFFM